MLKTDFHHIPERILRQNAKIGILNDSLFDMKPISSDIHK